MLKCELVELPEAVVVELHGELDLETVVTLRQYLAVAARCQKPILLDMKRLEYFDSAGARVIQVFLPNAWDQAGPVAIISPAPTVRRGLQVLEIDRQVPLFGSVASALSWLRTSPFELGDERKKP